MAAQPVASNYPATPIRLIVPQPPSGTVDMLARMIGGKLTGALGQQVVIDNRAGASGTIGSDIVAKAPADGHTLLIVPAGFAANPIMYKNLPYDQTRDLAPVSLTSMAPPASPSRTARSPARAPGSAPPPSRR